MCKCFLVVGNWLFLGWMFCCVWLGVLVWCLCVWFFGGDRCCWGMCLVLLCVVWCWVIVGFILFWRWCVGWCWMELVVWWFLCCCIWWMWCLFCGICFLCCGFFGWGLWDFVCWVIVLGVCKVFLLCCWIVVFYWMVLLIFFLLIVFFGIVYVGLVYWMFCKECVLFDFVDIFLFLCCVRYVGVVLCIIMV